MKSLIIRFLLKRRILHEIISIFRFSNRFFFFNLFAKTLHWILVKINHFRIVFHYLNDFFSSWSLTSILNHTKSFDEIFAINSISKQTRKKKNLTQNSNFWTSNSITKSWKFDFFQSNWREQWNLSTWFLFKMFSHFVKSIFSWIFYFFVQKSWFLNDFFSFFCIEFAITFETSINHANSTKSCEQIYVDNKCFFHDKTISKFWKKYFHDRQIIFEQTFRIIET